MVQIDPQSGAFALNRNKVEILHVLPGLRAGGVERILQEIVTCGDPRFHHRILSLSDIGSVGREIADAGVEVDAVNATSLAAGLLSLPRFISRAGRPDIIHGWIYHGTAAAILLRLVSRRSRVVVGFHATDLKTLKVRTSTRIAIHVARWLDRYADKVVYCSSSAARAHAEFGFTHPESVVISNGVDPRRFEPADRPKMEIRQDIGVPDAELPQIIVAARWAPQKDHATVLRALAILEQRGAPFQAVFCGAGIREDNRDLAALIRAAGLRRPPLIRGEISDMVPWLQASDILLLGSSDSEALPMVILEAMAVGVVSVATDVGDTPTALGDSGFIVPPGQPEAMADALARALALPQEEVERRAAASRSRIIEDYSSKRMLLEYNQMYLDLL